MWTAKDIDLSADPIVNPQAEQELITPLAAL
jgi:hypothetical protein